VLHTGMDEDSVSLTSVLGDLVMDKLNNIESDWSSEDSRESILADDLLRVLRVEYGDCGLC